MCKINTKRIHPTLLYFSIYICIKWNTDQLFLNVIFLVFFSSVENVTVICFNPISWEQRILLVAPLYEVNGYILTVDNTLHQTDENFNFVLTFDTSTNLPMKNVTIKIDFKNGVNATYLDDFHDTMVLPMQYSDSLLYSTQGSYNVTYTLTNPISTVTLVQSVRVWDNLLNTTLSCLSTCDIVASAETQLTFGFINTPRSGFKFSIDFKDGTVISDVGDAIMFDVNKLTTFNHTYTQSGTFNVTWYVENGEYNVSGEYTVIAQWRIVNLQVSIQMSS